MSRPIRDKFAKLPIDRRKKYMLRHNAKGLCITCNKPRVTKSHCEKHRAKRAAWQRGNERHREMDLKRTQERKRAGLCLRCLAPARPGKTHCAVCAKKMSAKTKAWQDKHFAAGLCRCGSGRAQGRVSCEKCLGRHVTYHRRWYATNR